MNALEKFKVEVERYYLTKTEFYNFRDVISNEIKEIKDLVATFKKETSGLITGVLKWSIVTLIGVLFQIIVGVIVGVILYFLPH